MTILSIRTLHKRTANMSSQYINIYTVEKEKDMLSGKIARGKTGQPKKGRPKGSKTANKEPPKVRTRSWLPGCVDTGTRSAPSFPSSSRTRSTSAAATTRDTPPTLPAYTNAREFVKDMRKLFQQWSHVRKDQDIAIEVELARAVSVCSA